MQLIIQYIISIFVYEFDQKQTMHMSESLSYPSKNLLSLLFLSDMLHPRSMCEASQG